jgi:hypothetical protein
VRNQKSNIEFENQYGLNMKKRVRRQIISTSNLDCILQSGHYEMTLGVWLQCSATQANIDHDGRNSGRPDLGTKGGCRQGRGEYRKEKMSMAACSSCSRLLVLDWQIDKKD